MTERIMLDIETLGTEPGAAILSIGAVKFGGEGMTWGFYKKVDLQSCRDAGLGIDVQTVEWWLSDEAPNINLDISEPLRDVLEDLSEFMSDVDEVWANSPSFDCKILRSAYWKVDMEPPWEFWQERDFRTLKNLPIDVNVDREGREHHALDDARYQARKAELILQEIGTEDLIPSRPDTHSDTDG